MEYVLLFYYSIDAKEVHAMQQCVAVSERQRADFLG
jgi:hypothetical protein